METWESSACDGGYDFCALINENTKCQRQQLKEMNESL